MKREKLLKLFVRFTISLLITFFSFSVAADNYVVIVNKENSYSGSVDEMKQMVRRLFLKEAQEWPNGIKSKPFNHKDDAVYHKFISEIIGMDARKIEEYWLGKKQKTGETPPRLGPEKLLSKLVAKSPGGLSYMLKSTAENSEGIRILFEF